MHQTIRTALFKLQWKCKNGEQMFAILNLFDGQGYYLHNITTKNSEATCEFDYDFVYSMNELGLFEGFMHTHPFGAKVTPSPLDISMHQGWANSLGMNISCLIFNGKKTNVFQFIPQNTWSSEMWTRFETTGHSYRRSVAPPNFLHFTLPNGCTLFTEQDKHLSRYMNKSRR